MKLITDDLKDLLKPLIEEEIKEYKKFLKEQKTMKTHLNYRKVYEQTATINEVEVLQDLGSKVLVKADGKGEIEVEKTELIFK